MPTRRIPASQRLQPAVVDRRLYGRRPPWADGARTAVRRGKEQSATGKSPDGGSRLPSRLATNLGCSAARRAEHRQHQCRCSIIDLPADASAAGLTVDELQWAAGLGFFADVVWWPARHPGLSRLLCQSDRGEAQPPCQRCDYPTMTIIEAAGHSRFEVASVTSPGAALDAYVGGLEMEVDPDQLTRWMPSAFHPRLSTDRSKTIAAADTGRLYRADPMIGLRLRHQFTPSQACFASRYQLRLLPQQPVLRQAAAARQPHAFNGYGCRRHRPRALPDERQILRQRRWVN